MSSTLQEGIYYSKGSKPGKFFSILFLRANSSKNATKIGEYISKLWDMYSDLKKGIIKDLPGHQMPDGNLSILMGYGQNIFKIEGIKKNIPHDLVNDLYTIQKPGILGGGGVVSGTAGLKYSSDIFQNVATEDIAIQFIAETQLAVNRCILETWKFLNENGNTETGKAALYLGHSFSGFQRDDGRSMLDFHDGISNMKTPDNPGEYEPRKKVIEIESTPVDADKWTENGTYLAFFRIAVDLGVWRKIPRSKQEIIIGRDKLSGCPIVNIDPNGNPILMSGCPVEGTKDIMDDKNKAFRDFKEGDIKHAELRRSHIMRANRNRDDDPAFPNSSRVFRQGYEFLEQINEEPGFRWGLNFVSFQDTPARLFRMLTQPGWLGNTNFGGNPNSPEDGVSGRPLPGMERLLSVRAAGIYLVPPLSETEKFPGSVLFF
jgi:deferrochelatase/peroxidase EfeB